MSNYQTVYTVQFDTGTIIPYIYSNNTNSYIVTIIVDSNNMLTGFSDNMNNLSLYNVNGFYISDTNYHFTIFNTSIGIDGFFVKQTNSNETIKPDSITFFYNQVQNTNNIEFSVSYNKTIHSQKFTCKKTHLYTLQSILFYSMEQEPEPETQMETMNFVAARKPNTNNDILNALISGNGSITGIGELSFFTY